jgi:hypothetical protein
MKKIDTIKVQGFSVNVQDDYICLTDMAKADGNEARAADTIRNWLNNKSTIEFLGTWEAINSTIFNVLGFQHVKENIGNAPAISVKSWVQATGAIGIYSKEGKYGGTYAHKDIAFEFGTAISPAFKLYLIKEFQRLKEFENNAGNIEWNVRRLLSKANYVIQTDAVKNYKIPTLNIDADRAYLAYAEEGDILNLALYGFTAKQWREANIELSAKGLTVRDFSSINELMVLTTLEGINAEMIKSGISFEDRLIKLRQISSEQLGTLNKVNGEFGMRKNKDGEFVSPHMANFPKPNGTVSHKGYLK